MHFVGGIRVELGYNDIRSFLALLVLKMGIIVAFQTKEIFVYKFLKNFMR